MTERGKEGGSWEGDGGREIIVIVSSFGMFNKWMAG